MSELFSVTYDADGNAKANVDFGAVVAGSLGSIIARADEVDVDSATYKTTTLSKLLDSDKFSLVANALFDDGIELSEIIEFATYKTFRIARVASTGNGYKETKRKLVSF